MDTDVPLIDKIDLFIDNILAEFLIKWILILISKEIKLKIESPKVQKKNGMGDCLRLFCALTKFCGKTNLAKLLTLLLKEEEKKVFRKFATKRD